MKQIQKQTAHYQAFSSVGNSWDVLSDAPLELVVADVCDNVRRTLSRTEDDHARVVVRTLDGSESVAVIIRRDGDTAYPQWLVKHWMAEANERWAARDLCAAMSAAQMAEAYSLVVAAVTADKRVRREHRTTADVSRTWRAYVRKMAEDARA